MYMCIWKIKETERYDYPDGSEKWADRENFYMHEEAAQAQEAKEKNKSNKGTVFVPVEDGVEKGFDAYDEKGKLCFTWRLRMTVMYTLKGA